METTSRQGGPSDLVAEFEPLDKGHRNALSPRPDEGFNAPPKKAALYERLWTWVPIKALVPRHRDRIAQHLLSLLPHDLYLRFGYIASPAQVRKYVDLLDFERDEVFGIFNRHLALIAMAHLAYPPSSASHVTHRMAEFGVSVLPSRRGRGYGSQLFDHAVLHARNRNVDALFIHALSENDAMLKIARRAGAVVKRQANESEAWLAIPDDNLASHLEEALVDQAGELNYQFKAHAKSLEDVWGTALGLAQTVDQNDDIPGEAQEPATCRVDGLPGSSQTKR
ncbi:MAG: GNAT family N-acetyltransferase [Rhizobacter sp.]